nr:Chain B, Platelet glycoprotein Ib alpha chain [Homo sapiens]
PTFRSSLFL